MRAACRPARLRDGRIARAGRAAGALRSVRGFTLIECTIACGVAAVLAAVALPSLRGHELRVARIDGVDALMRVQLAQERHHALHGLYAGDLAALHGVPAASRQGRYAVELRSEGDAYVAVARPVGTQAHDRECAALTLTVRQGLASTGPSARCWNR